MKKIEDKFYIFYFDNEMAKFNEKIEGLENRVNERFDSLEGLMNKIAKKLNIKVDE